MSLALYRRYRPETFAEVIGQEHVTGPLQQALAHDRVTHAYLFSGPRGCGKTTSARILARALNCEQGPAPEPCGHCQSCRDLARDGAGSLDVVEIDAASHGGVDDARDLRERAFISPASSRFKIYIIDEAHMVTPQGFNALLKVVEEPPPHLKFIFATTEPDKVLGTIRSRTHHYPFRLVPERTLLEYLQRLSEAERVEVGDGVLPMVVRAGAGSVRDALSVLDQLIGGAGPDGVTHAYAASLLGYTDVALLDDVVDALAAHDGRTVFAMVDRVVESGTDPRRFVADLLERLRDLIILQAVPEAASRGLLHASEDQLGRMQAQALHFGPAELARTAEVVNAGLTEMRGATAPRLQLELICARVLLPGADADAARGIGARLDRLERRFAIGAAPAAGPAPAAPSGQSASPAPPVAPAPAGPPDEEPVGGLDVHAVRRMWPNVLDEVKRRKRVAWMVTERVNVLGLDSGRLTLGFPDVGTLRAFGESGRNEVVGQTIIDLLGVDLTIEGVLDPGARPAGGPAPVAAAPSEPSAPRGAGPGPGAALAGPTQGATAAQPAPPDDAPHADDPDDDPGLSGAALIAEQLGGRVIGEIGAD